MPAREPPGVKSKAATSAATSRLNLESNFGLEISPLQSSLSRIRRALDDAAIYRRRTPSLMRSMLSIAAYSVLSKTTTPTGECARNDRRISRKMLSNSVRIEGATAKTGRNTDGKSPQILSRGGGGE